MYTFIYFNSLVFKLYQKQFSQKPTILWGGTILNSELNRLIQINLKLILKVALLGIEDWTYVTAQ